MNRYYNHRILANIKSISFNTKVEKVETDKKMTSCPSLAYITKILKLYFKMPAFNVEDLSRIAFILFPFKS